MNTAAASLMVAIVGGTCLWSTTYGLQVFTAEGVRRIDAARDMKPVPKVVLETMTGAQLLIPPDPLPTGQQPRDQQKIAILEFIYTSCPTICRTAGADLAHLRTQLKSAGLDQHVKILSVSFDPQHDGISELASYGDTHGADGDIWTVARPSQRDLTKLLDAYGVVVIPNQFGGFEHNAALHVVDRKGRLTAILDTDDVMGAVRATRQALQ